MQKTSLLILLFISTTFFAQTSMEEYEAINQKFQTLKSEYHKGEEKIEILDQILYCVENTAPAYDSLINLNIVTNEKEVKNHLKDLIAKCKKFEVDTRKNEILGVYETKFNSLENLIQYIIASDKFIKTAFIRQYEPLVKTKGSK